MPRLRIVFAACCLTALPAIAHSQPTAPSGAVPGGFQKQTSFGVWSKTAFADTVTVSGPAKIIYLSGMGSEDENTGTILHQGDFYEQCRYAYGKIKKILAAQGASMADIVKITTYVTDMRYRPDYAKCRAEAMGDAPLPTHTFINVSQLAWPGMMIEVDATAAIAAK